MDLGEHTTFSEYKQSKHRSKKIRSNLVSERFLLMIIKVLSSGVPMLHRSLMNIKRFLNIIDRKHYAADINTEALLQTCEMLVNTRLKSSRPLDTKTLIFKVDSLLTDDYETTKNNLIIPTIQLATTELPEEELDFIDQQLDYNLKYGKIIDEKEDLVDLATEISTCAYTDFKEVFLKFREKITDFYNFFRSTDSDTKINQVIHTSEPTFTSFLKNTFEAIKNPGSVLRTGIKALNSSLGPLGGFQNDNVYVFYANRNSFKSAFLLHLARMIKKYNGNAVKEEYLRTGKIPTVLFVEGENSENEDNERLYKTVVGSDMGAAKTPEDMEYNWIQSFKDDNPIDISFLHVDSRAMTMHNIDDMIESLEEEGYHVITCIIDYLEMIAPNPEDATKDIRIQYTHIADTMVNIAKRRHIPIITAHQLNRAGNVVLTNAKNQGVTNAIMSMTSEFIGESYGIDKAVSYAAFIDVEDHNGKRYLMYKRSRSRFRNFGMETFVHEIKDGIILQDDIDLPNSLSMEHIPDPTSDGLMKARENTGRRGSFDTRDKKPVKLHTETTIKPKEEIPKDPDKEKKKMYNMSLLLNFNDWYTYIPKYGLENIAQVTDEFTIDNTYKEKIGETEYCFIDFDND